METQPLGLWTQDDLLELVKRAPNHRITAVLTDMMEETSRQHIDAAEEYLQELNDLPQRAALVIDKTTMYVHMAGMLTHPNGSGDCRASLHCIRLGSCADARWFVLDQVQGLELMSRKRIEQLHRGSGVNRPSGPYVFTGGEVWEAALNIADLPTKFATWQDGKDIPAKVSKGGVVLP